MALRTVIAEDEPLVRQRLRRFIERDPRLQLVGAAESGTAAVEAATATAPVGSRPGWTRPARARAYSRGKARDARDGGEVCESIS